MSEIINLNGNPIVSEQKQEEEKQKAAEELLKYQEEQQAAIAEAMKKIEEGRIPLNESSVELVERIKAINDTLSLTTYGLKREPQNVEIPTETGTEKRRVNVPVNSFPMSLYDTFNEGANIRNTLLDRLFDLVIKL